MFNLYLLNLKIYNSKGYIDFTIQLQHKIINYFGNIDSASLTYEKILEFINDMKNLNLSNNTINKHISYLKRLYKFNDVECPFFKIKKLKEKFITLGCSDNIKNILPKILETQSLRNQLIIMLFFDTGIRCNELINIYTKNVDNENRCIFLEFTKTNKPRWIYYSKYTQKLMNKYLKKTKCELLFFSKKSNQKMNRFTINSIFSRIKKKFKLKNFSPHRLRHSLSTELYNNGADLLLISSILGHSNVNTTKRYIHSNHVDNLKKYDKFHHIKN